MKKHLLCLSFVLLASGCASEREAPPAAPPAQPIFDSLIVPGVRIGPVAVGMSGAQLLQAVGSPASSNHAFTDGTWNHFSNGIGAFVRDRDNRVIIVTSEDARYRTMEGVGPGVAELVVRSALGAPTRVLDADYNQARIYTNLYYPGMAVAIDPRTGRVVVISIPR